MRTEHSFHTTFVGKQLTLILVFDEENFATFHGCGLQEGEIDTEGNNQLVVLDLSITNFYEHKFMFAQLISDSLSFD